MPYRYRPISFVSTLPSSPVDGQEIYYQASGVMTASGVVWQMRYNASSSSAYKWEFVGGSPLYNNYYTTEGATLSNSTWGGISGNDPQLTVPIAGAYKVTSTVTLQPVGAAASLIHGIRTTISGVDTNPLDGATGGGYASVSGARACCVVDFVATYSTAGTILKQVYQHNQGSASTLNRIGASMMLTPVRVG